MKFFKRNTHTSRINDVKIDVYKLHAATENHPVENANISEFTNELNQPCWSTQKGKEDTKENRVSPNEVLEILEEHGFDKAIKKFPKLKHHIKQIQTVDCSYPIHVYNNHVVDGKHRLAQIAYNITSGKNPDSTVLVKRLEELPPVSIINTES